MECWNRWEIKITACTCNIADDECYDGDRRFEEAYDPIEGRVHNMCEVLDRIENRGYNRGYDGGVDHVSKIVISNLYKRGNTVHDIADILALEESQIERMIEEMGLER